MNFDQSNKQYKDRVKWRAGDLLDTRITEHIKNGGALDATILTKMFHDTVAAAQIIEDLWLGSGLDPLDKVKEEENAERNHETRDSQGPTGDQRDEVGVCNTEPSRKPSSYNGPTGGRKIDPPKLQPAPPQPRS